MYNKGQIGVGMIITLSVTLILGVIFLQIIFSTVADQQTQTAVTNDAFVVSNTSCTELTPNCYLGTTLTVDDGGVSATGNFTECGTGVASGRFNGAQLGAGADGNLTATTINASYTEISCSFLTGGTTRSVVNILPILFAVALLVFVAAFVVIRR